MVLFISLIIIIKKSFENSKWHLYYKLIICIYLLYEYVHYLRIFINLFSYKVRKNLLLLIVNKHQVKMKLWVSLAIVIFKIKIYKKIEVNRYSSTSSLCIELIYIMTNNIITIQSFTPLTASFVSVHCVVLTTNVPQWYKGAVTLRIFVEIKPNICYWVYVYLE